MTTTFPRRARKEDPTGWMVVQDNLDRMRDAFDAYVAGVAAPPAPTVLPTVLTGRIDAAGGITSGTGFSVVRSATGTYDITFTTAFAAVPTIVAALGVGVSLRQLRVTAASTTGATISIQTTVADSGAGANEPFNFIAYQTA